MEICQKRSLKKTLCLNARQPGNVLNGLTAQQSEIFKEFLSIDYSGTQAHMGSHYKGVHWFVLQKVITRGAEKKQTYLAKILHDFLN